MPRITFDSDPAFVHWSGVVRGDDESLPLYFANPGGYTITQLGDGAESVTVTDPIVLTGRTFIFSVAASRGGTVLFTGSVDTTNAATGQLTLSMTDAQTDLLTGSRYVWDLVENPTTSSETTLILGTMTVTGRATA
jgi:hypothetical protein